LYARTRSSQEVESGIQTAGDIPAAEAVDATGDACFGADTYWAVNAAATRPGNTDVTSARTHLPPEVGLVAFHFVATSVTAGAISGAALTRNATALDPQPPELIAGTA
jgi:hypothetical protein